MWGYCLLIELAIVAILALVEILSRLREKHHHRHCRECWKGIPRWIYHENGGLCNACKKEASERRNQ